MKRIHQAAKQFNAKKDTYEEFVFVLRCIRESYYISQTEMATLMNVAQGTISKFESFDLTARLDFLISYADVLGYKLIVCDKAADDNEPSRFRERQSSISKELSKLDFLELETITTPLTQKVERMPETVVFEHKKRIIKELRAARRKDEEAQFLRVLVELGKVTDGSLDDFFPEFFRDKNAAEEMSKRFKVSEHIVRRFEKDDEYMPSASLAFKYASYVHAEFRLSEELQTLEESIGVFYIRNCLALNNIFEKKDVALKKIHKSSDYYDEFVFILRSIREYYQIHQGEMAILMNVSQSTMSKFEAGILDVKWDFLLLYAGFLGYSVRSEYAGRGNELSRFNKRQLEIANELADISHQQIEEEYFSRVHCNTKWPIEIIEATKKSIVRDLVIAKHTYNHANYEINRINKLKKAEYDNYFAKKLLAMDWSFSEKTTQGSEVNDDCPAPAPPVYLDEVEELSTEVLAEKLGISERTLRRFENESGYGYMPSAELVFKYASLVNCKLTLHVFTEHGDSYRDFFLKRCMALHDWIGGKPSTKPSEEITA